MDFVELTSCSLAFEASHTQLFHCRPSGIDTNSLKRFR
jgi:hypothetical protein